MLAGKEQRAQPPARRLQGLGVLLLALGLTGGLGVRAQGTAHTFPETGHTVAGLFWAYWQAHGGLAQQGYPLTEEFTEVSALDGQPYTVQYFERAVFEKHPENQPPYDVLLSQLGTVRYQQKYPNGAPNQQPAAGGVRFPQTGHVVGGPFLAYWQSHGGLAQQGYPISEEFTEVSPLNGQPYTVQYFERAVFEKHPANPPPFDVLLSQLGTFQLRQKYPAGVPRPSVTAFGSPDDLTVDLHNGMIYFGDFGNGAINRLAPDGSPPQPVATGFREPEGLAVAADGSLVVVEQATNRLWRVDPAQGTKRLLRQLVNTTGQDGVDGLAIDPASGAILVPDSPNGRLLALSPDGSTLRTIAAGFTRPTGVALLPGGDLLVADEFGNTLDRVTPAGHKTVLSTMYQPDDVVVDAQGQAYVNGLNGIIYHVDPATGTRTVLLRGLQLPHGLAVDAQGQLVIAEAGRNRISFLVP